MARNVKDLREIINVSRLSIRNDMSSDEFSSDNMEERCNVDLSQYLLERPGSALSKSSFATLQASSSQKSLLCQSKPLKKHSNAANIESVERMTSRSNTVPLIYNITKNKRMDTYNKYTPIPPINKNEKGMKNFDKMFECIDSTVVNTWLEESNVKLEEFITYLKTNDNFTEFCNFFLNGLPSVKRNELLDLEFSIIIDQLKYAFHIGYRDEQVSSIDVHMLAKSVICEYPKKLKGKRGTLVMLDIILTFCSEKNEKYRTLLKKVYCKTENRQNIQWLLAIRAFALLNFVIGIINFFKNVQLVTADMVPSYSTKKNIYPNINCSRNDWLLQSVKKNYFEVCQYLLDYYDEFDYENLWDNKSRNLVFVAVVGRNTGMVEILMKHLPISCLNAPSENGNCPLQYAVGKGDISMVECLLMHGADVNFCNVQCEGATPLHTAVMLGDESIVTLLLRYGADLTSRMGVPAKITPYSLACELNLINIKVLLEDVSK